MSAKRKGNVCRRGHKMTGDNVKRRPSTKYVACRKCEQHATREWRKHKSVKDSSP